MECWCLVPYWCGLVFSSSLQELDVDGKKAIVVTVPFPQLKAFQKLHTKLTRELEKKYSGKVVVFIAKVQTVVRFLN